MIHQYFLGNPSTKVAKFIIGKFENDNPLPSLDLTSNGFEFENGVLNITANPDGLSCFVQDLHEYSVKILLSELINVNVQYFLVCENDTIYIEKITNLKDASSFTKYKNIIVKDPITEQKYKLYMLNGNLSLSDIN